MKKIWEAFLEGRKTYPLSGPYPWPNPNKEDVDWKNPKDGV